jgi:hypothetical protein
MRYSDYLELKESVLRGEATTDFLRERLGIPLVVARCMVKDWSEQSEDRAELVRALADKACDRNHEALSRLSKQENSF